MLPPDTTIHNRYRVIYIIDERPGSTVYRGRDEQSGRLVLLAALADDLSRRGDLAALAGQVATVQQEAILPVVDHFAEGDLFYVVCDDPGGQDLERTLRARGSPLPEDSTREQARRLLDALEYLHGQKPMLYLGDPLPGDLWIGEDGVWKLAPFTLIRPITHTPSPYRAPELDRPEAEPTIASDMYALNALLYHALTGWAPPTNAQREGGTPLNGPRTLNPTLSTLVEQVLLRGLQLKPENRYQVAREMRLSLDMVSMMETRPQGDGVNSAPRPAPVTTPLSQPNAPQPPQMYPPAPPQAPAPYPPGIYPAPPPPAQPAPVTSGYPQQQGQPYPQQGQPYPQQGQPYLQQQGQPYPQQGQPYPQQQGQPYPQQQGQPYPQQGQPYPQGVYAAPPQKRGVSTGCLIAIAVLLLLLALAICAALAFFILPNLLPNLLSSRAASAPTALSAATVAPAIGVEPVVPTGAPAASAVPANLGPRAITLQNASQITQTREITSVVLGPVSFAPDGKTLAVGINNVISLRDASSLEDFNPSRQLAGHTGAVFALAWSPDSKLLASGSMSENSIRLWDMSNDKLLRQLNGHTNWIRALAFSPDGKLLASGSFDNSVRLWDVATGNSLWTASEHTNFISAIAFTPDGKALVSSSRDGTVRMWDVASGKALPGFSYKAPLNAATNTPLWTTGLAFSKDGKTLAIGLMDGSVAIVDAATGTTERTLRGHTSTVVSRGMQFSPDGKILATGSLDGTVRLWDIASGTQTAELPNNGQVIALSFSADGTQLASISDQGGQMLIWSVQAPQSAHSYRVGQGLIRSMLFSPDSSVLGTVGSNGTSFLRAMAANRARALLGASAGDKSLGFLADDRLVSITDQNTIAIIGPNDPQGKTLEGLDGEPFNLVTSADGKLIIAGSSTGTIGLWDGATGAAKPAIHSGLSAIYTLAANADGSLIAAGGSPNQLKIEIWDSSTGKLRQTLTGFPGALTNLSFQSHGDLLAATDIEGGLRIWNAQDGKLVKTIMAGSEQGWFSALAWSPDGSMLATGSPNGDLVFHNIDTGADAARLSMTDAGVTALAFSPDGQTLAASLYDQTIRIFEVGTK